jgi:hypothetical protein
VLVWYQATRSTPGDVTCTRALHLEQVISGHSCLAWDSCRNDHHASAIQGFPQLLVTDVALMQTQGEGESLNKIIQRLS